jgi:hypothetical protein
MFIFDAETPLLHPLALTRLDGNSVRLLWCLRRLALMAPLESARCQAVHIALQRDFGDAGLGIEHLLRCLLVGLARYASRRLAIATPGSAMLTNDEAAMLALFTAPSASALVALAGADAEPLLPLCQALQALTQESDAAAR